MDTYPFPFKMLHPVDGQLLKQYTFPVVKSNGKQEITNINVYINMNIYTVYIYIYMCV